MESIEHDFTDEIICPHCGEEWSDSWELDDGGVLECYACEEEFTYNRNITIDYSTNKIFCKKEGHKWRKPQFVWFDEGKKQNLWRRTCSACSTSEQGYEPEWKPEHFKQREDT